MAHHFAGRPVDRQEKEHTDHTKGIAMDAYQQLATNKHGD